MEFTEFLKLILPSLTVGVLMAVFNRRQAKREAAEQKMTEEQRRESVLHLELIMATAKLSYAVAMAIKRGKANGEVEEGIEAYEKAKRRYDAFLKEIAAEHLID